ncbi:MAG: Flp pilus assembly complex ATPase component TadA [Alphaproteobacteria bacterium]|uniref:Flp pilus assembly complex ATPase component TadA n=1 Tax=Candidatus Nitrobium versatile TaxID=2884831 RepID=A0A953JA38_9BACT|nr:Flp pilus assembly complex ATPase component TadA [Candidatus Nitrobium versatile]
MSEKTAPGEASPGDFAPRGFPDSDGSRFTLLFVDDEEDVLNALRRIFLEENYRILTAPSAEKVLSLMQENAVHLVISDYKMPGMTGSELLREIKERWPETIRIMLTGHADVNAIMGAINEGAVYKFITKPWNDDDLRITVSLALQQYSLIQENKKLKEVAKQQQQKLRNYSALFDEYRGILSSILLKAGIISPEQLGKASKEKMPDEQIGDTLVRLGHVSEATIVKVLQKNQGIDAIDLGEMHINPNIARFLPRDLCEKNRLIPVKMEGKHLFIAMADPSDVVKTDNISLLTGFKVVPLIARSSEIVQQLRRLYGERSEGEATGEPEINAEELDPIEDIDIVIEEEEAEANVQELVSSSGVPPIVRIVNAIVLEAMRYQASDIHIEPKTKYTVIRYRIDGMLHTKIKVPSTLHAAVVSRIKILAKMDISERRKPQDGRITIKTGTRIVDLRVSTMPTISGEKVVMRMLDKGASIKKISELGMLPYDLQRLEVIIRKPQGILISTGPTGSGKTTMLYSILYEMLKPTKNFETIEDPVEYFLEDANQVYVRERIGLSFASVLRATLRQDPDVLLVGEIRDYETADVAFKAALTGHMVLTSLHTNNTVASITRLTDIGVKPYLIASAVEGIIAQRLLRKICPHCKTTASPDPEVLHLLKVPDTAFGEVATGKGCGRCNQTGYLGRTGIFELFAMNDEFRQLISTDYKESEIMNLARAGGMRTLIEDGLEKVKAGVTTPEELLRVLGPPTRYERQCESCGNMIDIKFLFCPHCGSFRHDICHACKMPLEEEWKVCPFCGTVRRKQKNTEAGS